MNAPGSNAPEPTVVPPGWHPDPWGHGALRWWDGREWTQHLSAPVPPSLTAAPITLVTKAEGTATWLTWLVLVMPLVTFGSVTGYGLLFRRFFDFFGEIDTTPGADNDAQFGEFFSDLSTIHGWSAALQLLQLLALAVLAIRMVWTYQVVNAARAVGRGGDRDPGLACASWIIPIINLWWPYQMMRDLFPVAERPNNRLIVWWITYLVGTLAIAGVIVTMFLPTAGLIVVAVLTAIAAAVSAVLERQLVSEATGLVRRDVEGA